ncbi:Protein DML1 [Pseudocercospora fuligena]|uniref:Protein DML1 n=1 Tax=Pseudocercospora fuligena TaxID=685502 RepID=A0A8H6RTD9_9PEZI|nr:Protein DML1 [Pseudocercospora fuligena]
MHEIVTLQFGNQANYLSTHYWNTQESYFTYAGQDESPVDHDLSFRPGIGADGSDTYTPRTVIYDLKGAFGTLRRDNALYELQNQQSPAQQNPWGSNAIPLRLPPITPSAYQQALDAGTDLPSLTSDTVRFWSDYNHVFYHPKSIVQLNEYELNSSLMPFEQWSKGEELFANLDREHDLLDRDLRPFLEECDQLQGIQIFSGTDDAWGGFASSYLERIADELGKGCRWVFGLQDTRRTTRDRQLLQLANTAQSIYALNPSASLHVPIASLPASLPAYASLGDSSRWCTAALQAAAIESITLPTRLRGTHSAGATFDNLESVLNGEGNRRIAACQISVSVESPDHEGLPANGTSDSRMTKGLVHDDERDSDETKADIDLFPQLAVTSAASRRQDRRRPQLFSKISSVRDKYGHQSELDTHDEQDRARFSAGPRTYSYRPILSFSMLSSYPRIFNFEPRSTDLAIDASLSTHSDIAQRLRSVEGIARRMAGVDEREALCDGLAAMADEYEEGWISDSESEDE